MYSKYFGVLCAFLLAISLFCPAPAAATDNTDERINSHCDKKWGADKNMAAHCKKKYRKQFKDLEDDFDSADLQDKDIEKIRRNCERRHGQDLDAVMKCRRNKLGAGGESIKYRDLDAPTAEGGAATAEGGTATAQGGEATASDVSNELANEAEQDIQDQLSTGAPAIPTWVELGNTDLWQNCYRKYPASENMQRQCYDVEVGLRELEFDDSPPKKLPEQTVIGPSSDAVPPKAKEGEEGEDSEVGEGTEGADGE